jgi:hypothetical protein
VEDLVANIQLCSDEKKSKVAPYRARYNVWWLLLVDFIGYGIDAFDRANLKTQTQITHGWDKLIVVCPVDPSNAYEI